MSSIMKGLQGPMSEEMDDDEFDAMMARLKQKAKQQEKLRAQGKEPPTKYNPETGKYYVDFDDEQVKETSSTGQGGGSAGIGGGAGLGIDKSPMEKILEKPLGEDTAYAGGGGQGGSAGQSYRKFKPKSAGVSETSDYFRRREREEAIISGKKPARKKSPAQTSDYAKRREQEKKQGVEEGRFDEPLTGWHIVYRKSGNPVHGTPSFETQDQAQKYLMTRMFANHHEFKVVHTAGVGVAEGAPELLKQEMPLVRHIEKELAQHGYEKGTPEYDQMFKHAMAMYRKFGNVDAIKRGVAEGIVDAFKSKPLPTKPETIKLGNFTVEIQPRGSYIGFAWHDSQGKEHYGEARTEADELSVLNRNDLIKEIKGEIKYQEKQLKKQGMAEGLDKNVVKSIKVGNFRHDLVDTGMGWQVRIYNGDELYDTGMSKNSEQKGLAALEDAVAYTEKQTRTKRQGVAEAAKWRSNPDAYDKDEEGNIRPKGPKFTTDPLAYREKHAGDAKTLRGKTQNLKYSLQYAKGKHGPVRILPEQGVSEGSIHQGDLYNAVIEYFRSDRGYRNAMIMRKKAQAGMSAEELATLLNDFSAKKWGTKLTPSDAVDAVKNIVYPHRFEQGVEKTTEGWQDDERRRFKSQELQHELGREQSNNIQVKIDGRPWKVFAGRGRPDSAEEYRHLRSMKAWAEKKSAETGKKWEVYLTGAPATVKENEQSLGKGIDSAKPMSVEQLATISDEALDNAYHYGRSSPGNTFGWQANLKSAEFAKKAIESGITDIDKISDAIHRGWNMTARAFVQNPDQFDDTAKLKAAGKLEAKLAQREKLMNINYAQLPEDEKEKDRVVARALLQAIKGGQAVAEEQAPMFTPEAKMVNANNPTGTGWRYYKAAPAGAKESAIMKGLQTEENMNEYELGSTKKIVFSKENPPSLDYLYQQFIHRMLSSENILEPQDWIERVNKHYGLNYTWRDYQNRGRNDHTDNWQKVVKKYIVKIK